MSSKSMPKSRQTCNKLCEHVSKNILKSSKIEPKSTKNRYRNRGQTKDRKNIEKSEPWDLFPGAYFRPKSLKNRINNSTKNQCLKNKEK